MPKVRVYFTRSCPWSTFPQITQVTPHTTQPHTAEVVELEEEENNTPEGLVHSIDESDNLGVLPNGDVQLASGYGGEAYDELTKPLASKNLVSKDGEDVLPELAKQADNSGRKRSPLKEKAGDEKEGGSCRWSDKSVKVLVDAKQIELKRLMDKSDTKFHMLKAQSKWQKISEYVNSMGYNFTWKQCRDKWGAELTVYKRLSD